MAVCFPSFAAAQTGKQDYDAYCAECHGDTGKGDGPGTKVLATNPPPPDLTHLSAHNGGKFPLDEVVDIIDGRKAIPSHARLQMPFLGVKLQKPGEEFTPSSDAQVTSRIDAIAHYVETMQQK